MALAPKKTDEEIDNEDDDIIIEFEDDTPAEDKGRDVADDDTSDDKDGEATDDELKNYSQEAQHRIRVLTKKRHDERRAKEKALRVQDEAVTTARSALSEVQKLREQLKTTATAAVGAHKGQVEAEITDLKKQLADAFDAADGAKAAEITEKLADARGRLTATAHAESRLKEPNPDSGKQPSGEPDPNDPKNWPADRRKWSEENKDWFLKDKKMTSYVYGIHAELIEDRGIEPDSPEYFAAINKEMRKVFPDKFKRNDDDDDDDFDFGEDDDEKPKRKPGKAKERVSSFGSGTVIKSIKSNGKTVYKLTESQRALCKRLGISEKDYVKAEIAKERQ